jgi:ABC-type antimicrobial peptide transport system permease subunit
MNNKRKIPPWLAQYLLRIFLTSEERSTILGDLNEYYSEVVEERSQLSAGLWYWRQVVRSAISLLKKSICWRGIMFNNYLKVTLRNFKKYKFFTLINIVGLASAMVCSILIFLWVMDELSFDKYHEHAEDLYIIAQTIELGKGKTVTVSTAPSAAAPALKNDYPEVIQSTRLTWGFGLGVAYGDKFFNERIRFTDASIFKMFSYPILQGDPVNPFKDVNSIVISEQMAKKYFGDQNPLGKMLKVDNKHSLMVSAVMKNIPQNSTFGFHFLVPLTFWESQGIKLNRWSSNDFYTFVQLRPLVDPEVFSKKIANLQSQHLKDYNADMFLFPYTKLRLYSVDGGSGRIKSVYIFILVALAVLLVACINFINLTIARAKNRSREVILRKVVGSNRHELVKQFFGESFLMVIISMMVALILVTLLLPVFNTMVNKELSLASGSSLHIIIGIVIMVFLTGVISGIYPALVISAFNPAQTLKDASGTGPKRSRLKKVLVVSQFTLSVILIVATLVVYQQLQFMHNKDMGLNKDNVLCIKGNDGIVKGFETLKNEWLKRPEILNVSTSMLRPSRMTMFDANWQWEGKDPGKKVEINKNWVGYDFAKTFKIKMVEGRFYSPEFPGDRRGSIVINETLAKLMGPGSPVGKPFWRGSDKRVIIGIIEDFHHQPLDRKSGPLMLHLNNNRVENIYVRLASQDIPKSLSYIEDTFRKINPNSPYQAQFLDEIYGQMYQSYHQFGEIFFSFTILVIMISCLGLLGLVSFLGQLKAREIGIRKVLGASVNNILWLLSQEFLVLVFIANMIAWPVSYLLMRSWLEGFAYRTSITGWIFSLAILISLVLALVTISYQAIKAAMTDPAKTLREQT